MFKTFKRCLCLDCYDGTYNTEETGITCDDVLRNVYEEKCSFPLNRHEVQNIQHAVEIMVFYLLTAIYEQTRFSNLVSSNKKIIKTLTSMKMPYRIHEAFRRENLLKVGSFYENTKNCYPDEFDYVCVIADCDFEDYIGMKTITSTISDIFHETLYEAIQNGLTFPVDNCLEFDKYIRLHGPAASLKFKYRSLNDSSDYRSILVDLSPACKVSIRNELPEEMRIPYSEWRDIILEKGSFLIVKFYNSGHPKNETKTKISITESEKHFMQNKMSKEHKRVYRLLKFIFHGNLSDEDLKRHIRDRENRLAIVCCRLIHPRIVYDFSSYIIKTLMFHHCHSCNRTVETTDRDCIVATLKSLQELFIKEQRKLHQDKKISVSVLTMTGEDIEIADRYRSSKKIVKVLNKFVQAITDTKQNEPLPQRIIDHIPLANKLRAIGQRDTVKHTSGKGKIHKGCEFCLIVSIVLFIASVYFTVHYVFVLIEKINHESEYCFLGQSAVDGIIFAEHENLTSNFSQTPHADIPRNISTHFLCLDQPFSSGKVVATKQRLYFCGYGRNCTGDRCYRLKTDKDGHGQEAFCDSYTFPDNENDLINSTGQIIASMEYSARRVVCVWDFKSCLNVLKRNSLGVPLQSDTSTCFDKERSYLHIFMQERNIMDCNATKLEKYTSNNGSICCCDSYPCSYPETALEIKIIMLKIFISALVGLKLLCVGTYCGCCGIISCIKYCQRKRRLRRGNIL